MIIFRLLTFKRRQSEGALVENRCRLQIINDLLVLLEWTCHLLPRHKFRHLLRELPEFLEIYVSVWQSAKKVRS